MMNKFLGLVLFLLVGTAAMAQTGKVGYVNTDQVVAIMPSFQTAQTQLETYANSVVTPEIEQKQTALEARYAKFQTESETMSEARREVEAKEIMKMEQELNQIAQPVNQQIAQKRNELMAPVQVEAEELISSVAKANGFTVVLDPRAGIVWAEDSINLLPLIKTKLGVQ